MVLGRLDPGLHLGCECVHVHAGERRDGDLFEFAHGKLGDRFEVAGQHGFERLDTRASSGSRFDHSRHAIEAIEQLRIDRMLDPQGAVLIEGRDALLRRDEILARRIGRVAHEIQDRLFCRAVVPGGERLGALRPRRRAGNKRGQRRQRGERAEQPAAAQARGKG